MIGFAKNDTTLAGTYPGAVANSWGYFCANGNKYAAGTITAFGPSARTGDKIVMKFSFADPIVRVFKNGGLAGYISDILFLFLIFIYFFKTGEIFHLIITTYEFLLHFIV